MTTQLGSLSQRTRRSGFTLAEVMLALAVFSMMTLMFAAVFPTAVRGAQFSGNYAQGTMLAQQKMEQLRANGYGSLVDDVQSTALDKLKSLQLIDGQNPDGSYDFTTSDNLTNNGVTQGYFPPGSTGTITVMPYTAGGVPGGSLVYVTITVAWTGGGVSNGSTSVSAIISKDAIP